MINIVWFRKDLRLGDNPALFEATQNGDILPIYIFNNKNIIGEASQWWLYNSLMALNKSLDNKLNIYSGDDLEIILQIINNFKIKSLYCNRCYDAEKIKADDQIKIILLSKGIDFKSFNGSLLWEPSDILKKDKSYYQIYGAFYKKCLSSDAPRKTIEKPEKIIAIKDDSLDDINLLPKNKWYKKIEKYWDIGGLAAQDKLVNFIKNDLTSYDEDRNYPAKNNTSKLSPHLHFGEISPNQIWSKIQNQSADIKKELNIQSFLGEIIWREFSYYIFYHFPKLTIDNFKSKFDQFSWENNMNYFEAWKNGQTGYPIIDAGMRELWQTGFMHNRLRMITASFLVKNLLIDWRYGEKWFEDCLIDADYASNAMGWQWIAGSGVNPAPYSRIFNPVIQGEKFDKNGEYTLKYIPELANIPKKFLFKPWEASLDILENAGIILGKDYPNPIIDLKYSKIKAIERYKKCISLNHFISNC